MTALDRGVAQRGDRDVDVNYLFHRQQTERSRAANASSETARKIHEQLASEYERLIQDATQGRVSFVNAATETASPDRAGD